MAWHGPSSRSRSRQQSQRSTSDSLAACLLIKDDNDILDEWIAYHYHVWNLRHLLVAVDPSSRTSPRATLTRWTEVTDLDVRVWDDVDYLPESFRTLGYHIPPRYVSGDAQRSQWHVGHESAAQVVADRTRINNHRYRQVTLLTHCYRHWRERNATWVLHVDTDEYLTLNPIRRRLHTTAGSPVVPVKLVQPGCLFRFWNALLRDNVQARAANAHHSCVSMPRLLFGAMETNRSVVTTTTTAGTAAANPQRFETLRWRYHAAYNDTVHNAQPKTLVDVSRVPAHDELWQQAFSIHRPSKVLCRRIEQLNLRTPNRYPLAVFHYLGTWERYVARNDTRRSRRVYDAKAAAGAGGRPEDSMEDWFDGWVHDVGIETARYLLRDYFRYPGNSVTNASRYYDTLA